MLLEFKVANFRSIGDEVTLSLEPAPDVTEKADTLITRGAWQALPVVGLYGANSSGKSNVLKAMATMIYLIDSSAQRSSTDRLEYEPFIMGKESIRNTKPTHYEITFYYKSVVYVYGFAYIYDTVEVEYLHKKLNEDEQITLFSRVGQDIKVGNSKEMSGAGALIKNTRKNALFLSVCDQFNVNFAVTLFSWTSNFDWMIDYKIESAVSSSTEEMMEDKQGNLEINQLLSNMNLGFKMLSIQKEKIGVHNIFNPNLPGYIKGDIINNLDRFKFSQEVTRFFTVHAFIDENGNESDAEIFFDVSEHESEGTQHAIWLIGPVLHALKYGGILVIDELDLHLHPEMTHYIIGLFRFPEINQKGAQLIFATHDTRTLKYSNLREDQIYFTEKNKWESTTLRSLVEFKEVNPEDIEADYLDGIYGGVPYLDALSKLDLKYGEKE